jgi:CheY-like chemotaxis protein
MTLPVNATAKGSVLLVEDNPDDACLIQRAFNKAEIKVPLHVVRDGGEARAYLTGEELYSNRLDYPFPSMLILDLKLPLDNGYELLSWIRSLTATRQLIVLVLSSSFREQDVRKAYDLGANSYLVKPVEFAQLVETLKAVKAYWLDFNCVPGVKPGIAP